MKPSLAFMIFNSLQIMKPEPLSEEVDKPPKSDRTEKKPPSPATAAAAPPPAGGDGASIEVGKRPRGRPPGSRNKPKPPEVITRESEPSASMRSHVLEISSGHDVVECLSRFARRRNLGICVLAGAGSVAGAALRQPGGGSENAAVVFHGRFEILSISATFMPPAMAAALATPASGGVSVSLAGPQGQVIGGAVVGPLLAAGVVMVMSATFSNPSFHRLPADDEDSMSVSGNDDSPAISQQKKQYREEQQQQQQQRFYHHFPAMSAAPAADSGAGESGGMGMYGAHFPQEMLWGAGSRPPHPPDY